VDILESTFMIRVLRPWFNNTSKRLVKRPKIYLNDSGLFHRLQSIPRRTKSMTAAMENLDLTHLWVVYPGQDNYPIGEKISVQSISNIQKIFE